MKACIERQGTRTLIRVLTLGLKRRFMRSQFEFSVHSKRWLRLSPSTLARLAFMLSAPGAVLADGHLANCVRGYSGSANDPLYMYQLFPTTTVSVGRDAVAGDVIGPWLTAFAPTAWFCTVKDSVPYQMTVQSAPRFPRISASVEHDGQTYSSYNTSDPSIGYIARWRYMVDGRVSGWTPLTVPKGEHQTPAHSFTMDHTKGQMYILGVETQIKFVKRVAHIPSGFQNKAFDPIDVQHHQFSLGGGMSSGTGTYRISQYLAKFVTFLAGGTCTTPDVNVDLGTVPNASFSGVGTTAALKTFELSLQNCPSGLDAIGYKFGATTSVVDASNGVVAADSSATTRGIGVAFLDEFDSPLQFGHLYPLSTYDTESGGSYTVPLKTGLYQTDSVIRGGTIKSAITFTLDYK